MTKLQRITLRRVKKLIEERSWPLPTISSYLPDNMDRSAREKIQAIDAENRKEWTAAYAGIAEASNLLDALLDEGDE
jgi:hypothetical protein